MTAVIIFAAGLGTRMGALTADRPKPLIPVAGRPLIDHALDLTRALPGARRVINLHYRGQMIRDHLAGQDIAYSEEPALLETGGGLRAALPLLGPGPVMTLNPDAIWTGPNPLLALRDGWQPQRMEVLLSVVPRDRATGHTGKGDFDMDADGRLTRGTAWVYTGAQLLLPDRLNAIPETVFSLNRLWDKAAADGRLFGLPHQGGWCDVGRPEGIALAETLLAGAP
jgi:N-acetyl-alpha-D-muramate 1-phosphate uridylyltransferase